jgi:Kef-type K+ transport system membrane component KefB
VGDVSAWMLLAAVVLIVRADSASIPLWLTVIGTVAFAAGVLLLARPQLKRLEALFERRGHITQDVLTVIVLLTLLAAAVTEGLGIHALFGAFLVGAALPKGDAFVEAVREKLEDLTVVLLLPLYFAFTGLRTSVGLLGDGSFWVYCALIIMVAVAGKWGGAMLAARATGFGWRESSAIGVLMNTRGLVELVLLNVGLDIGILSPSLFAMLVLMALVTTGMTTPLLEVVLPQRLIRAEAAEPVGGQAGAGAA